MADTKATGLSPFAPIGTDIMYGVDDPGGTPISGKHTYNVLRDYIQANLTQITLSSDVILKREAANSLVQVNGANAQSFRIANKDIDDGNDEYGFFRFVSNVLEIGTEKSGSGSNRDVQIVAVGPILKLGAGGVVGWEITSDSLRPIANNTEFLGHATRRISDFFLGSFTEILEMTAPGVGPANTARLYALADSGGLTNLETVFQAGAPLTIAAEGTTGTPGTGTTAVEHGDGYNMVTVLTMAGTLPAITGDTAQSVGLLLYTLPAGVCRVKSVHMDVGITQSQGNINADTPKVGIGSLIADTAVSVLNGTTEFDDYVVEQEASNCTGTVTDKTEDTSPAGLKLIEDGGMKTIFFNAADGWAASAGGDAAATLSGTVTIEWTFLGA